MGLAVGGRAGSRLAPYIGLRASRGTILRQVRRLPDPSTSAVRALGVDKLAARMDERRRRIDGASATVAELAAAEPLLEIPTRPFPAELEVERTVSPQGLVSFDGNQYSVPPGLPGAQVKVLRRLGEDYLHVLTAGRAVVAKHHRAPGGSGQVVRDAGHVIALERAVLASFSDRAPCKSKVRRPPSEAAIAEADRLRGTGTSGSASAERVVVDLSHYAAVADRLRTAPTPEEDHRE
ncbi:transposase [Kitasatospora sp. NPDC057198]|uniref:Mu transposase domain-containing protein n=1 Tax=Kitasatospora sp. NPDC057198 TaxID=3346046 RepID=UPI0036368A30